MKPDFDEEIGGTFAMDAPEDVRLATSDLYAARSFNPDELRGPDGKWIGGGAIHDALKLAGRIQLGHDEKLAGSGRISPSSGHDVDTLFAVVDSPRGRQIRVGIVPTHDVAKWRAANRGGTVNLKPLDVAHLRDDLEAANKTAKAAAAKADREWASGGHPDLSKAVAEGSVASEWGNLRWSTYLTDDDPTSWTTSLGVGAESGDSVYEPADLRKLIRTLDELAKSGA